MFWYKITTTKITQTSKRMYLRDTVTCTWMAVSRFESNFVLSYPAELRYPSPPGHTPFWAGSCWQSLLVPEVHIGIASCPRDTQAVDVGWFSGTESVVISWLLSDPFIDAAVHCTWHHIHMTNLEQSWLPCYHYLRFITMLQQPAKLSSSNGINLSCWSNNTRVSSNSILPFQLYTLEKEWLFWATITAVADISLSCWWWQGFQRRLTASQWIHILYMSACKWLELPFGITRDQQ